MPGLVGAPERETSRRRDVTDIVIRPLERSDYAAWRRLWTGYLEFYKAAVSEEVYATTWRRLFDGGEFEPKGLLAIVGGKPIGLVHYIYHRTCWSLVNNCYLQDLFADPASRGTGVGRALIESASPTSTG
jgi:GNAT superfamily N-acetyltransferase